jgi:GNAT superfamily N-acetyltransferase
MDQRITIRTATSGDAEAVADLLTQLGYPTTAADARERIAYLGSEHDAILLAIDGAQVCGMATVHILPVIHYTGTMARVTAFVVDANCRGRGVGKILLAAIREFASVRKVHRIEVVSGNHRPQAHAFYEGAGYKRTDQARFILDLNP